MRRQASETKDDTGRKGWPTTPPSAHLAGGAWTSLCLVLHAAERSSLEPNARPQARRHGKDCSTSLDSERMKAALLSALPQNQASFTM